jgi:hypothetical protein
MNRLVTYLPSIILLIGLIVPTAGPLVDHHFADRQPGHNHLLLVSDHLHAVDGQHSHLLTGDSEGGAGPATLYNYDSGLAISQDAPRDAPSLLASLQYEPTSVLILPLHPVATLTGQTISPPSKLPRLLA